LCPVIDFYFPYESVLQMTKSPIGRVEGRFVVHFLDICFLKKKREEEERGENYAILFNTVSLSPMHYYGW